MIAELGSGVPVFCPCPPIARDSWDHVLLVAEPGTLAFWKLSDLVLLFCSCTVDMFSGCICGLASCVFPAPPIVNDNLGALLVPMFNRGTSLGGCPWPSSPTGLAFGDGGIPKDSFGVREPLWLRPWPGTGARKRGTGLVIVKGASLASVRQLKYEAGWIESNGRCGLW